MAFPEEVLVVKERLKISSQHFEAKKALYKTICSLTEPTAMAKKGNDRAYYLSDYEEMWASIKKNSDPEDQEDGQWALAFIHAVTRASQVPTYRKLTKKEKLSAIEDINSLSSQLIGLYKNLGLDAQIVLNNQELLKVKAKSKISGLYIYEDLHEIEKNCAGSSQFLNKKKDKEFILFSQLIKMFSERSQSLLKNVINIPGNKSENASAIFFARNLARHIRSCYGRPMNMVIAVSTFALHGTYYEPADISNLMTRYKR